MRSCPRSEELRAALAAEEPLDESLRAHVAGCAMCAHTAAGARRFESRLDLAMSELVTDALPPSTATIARTAPRATRGRRAPSILAIAVLATAIVGVVLVGGAATGSGLMDAIFGRLGIGAAPSAEAIETIDCYLGEAVVEIEGASDSFTEPGVRVAYCIGDAASTVSAGAVISCVRSFEAGSARGQSDGDDTGYLAACTRVEELGTAEAPAEQPATVRPARPFNSWAEATDAIDWPVREPTWLPDGYQLAALQGFTVVESSGTTDSVVATYLRSGAPLTLEQFVIADPDGFRVELALPSDGVRGVTTGQTTVNGQAAFWASGVGIQTGNPPEARVNALVLAWRDGTVGYRITAPDLDLEALRLMAASIGEEESGRIEGEAAMFEERAELARR